MKPSSSLGKKDATILPKPQKKNHILASRPEEQSPTGSTVSVEDRKMKTPAKTPFSESSFRAGDAESPFVGNIKIATPTQRVPQSTLFSQAFVAQHQADANGEESVNVRWQAMDSPLFVAPNNAPPASGGSSYLQFHSPRVQPPTEDHNTSAFDMTSLEDSLLDGDASIGSFELNETIVYADDTQNPMDCCGATSAFCGSESVFEGLVQTCGGDVDAFKQQKEKRNKIPSPRRKNLLSRLRKKGKKSKSKNKVEYGNLDDDEEREEASRPKGVRRAHVQLARQKLVGSTSHNQFALLLDDEICI